MKRFNITRGPTRKAHRTLIYGVGGIGKTSLVALADNVVLIDLEGGSVDHDIPRIDTVSTWADLRALLQSDVFDDMKTVAIDSLTKAEELCKAHVLANVMTEKGQRVGSIEGYGFGKGYTHLVEEWRKGIGDLERLYLAGKDIVMVAHANIGKTPNPTGDDYIRHEPRLHHSDKASVRAVTIEWCDHVLFLGYDVAADEGKAKGSGSRTIYTHEQATHIAKSRTLPPTPIIYKKGDRTVWELIKSQPAPAISAAPEI